MPPRPPDLPKQRQPLCPYCEYNLTGVFDRLTMQQVRCPECGERMEAHEVQWSRKPGDWTLAMGLRNAALFLLMRGTLVAGLLIASVFAVEGLGHLLQRIWTGFPFTLAMLILILLPTGIGCGKLLMRGLEDAAGIYGVVLPFAATLALAVAGLLIALALPGLTTFAHAPVQGMIFMACAVAAVVIVFDFMSEAA